MEKTYEDNEEIDLLEIFFALKRKLWLIILAMLLGGVGAGTYTTFLMTPMYESTAVMYVLSKETTLSSLADLQIGSQLANDYEVVATSRPVLQEVIGNLGLDMDYKALRQRLTIDNPADTRMMAITITDPSPERAKAIVDEVANVSSQYIGDIMEMVPPKMIEEGEAAIEPSSPSLKKNMALGALAGIALVCAAVTLKVILNDTVRTEEDVQKYLGMSVLAVIPKRGESGGKKSSRKKK